ncbi:MAG: NUDIX hydrolase [Steroidobacteraceae bacterium]
MEDLWLQWAKRLQSIASTGAHFAHGAYDRERYVEVASIANQMLAHLGAVPVSRIEALVPDFAAGYATPKVDVRGALFQDQKILLVREQCDGLWSLPGGFADVGKSPSENIEKEIWEEATLKARATALYAVRHKAKHEYDADARDFYKLFFLCEPIDATVPVPGPETSQVQFFGRDELPPLSTGRTLEKDIAAAFAHRADPTRPATFD